MKFRTTQKEINNGYSMVVRVGYCGCQYLFYGVEPVAYTCGVYGWNADIYEIGGTAIVTGYSPFGSAAYRDIIAEYEKKCENLVNNDKRYKSYNGKIKGVERLRRECFRKIWAE